MWRLQEIGAFILSPARITRRLLRFLFVRRRMPGLLMAVSTPESTRKTKDNYETARAGCIITEPAWLSYDCWFFQDLVPMNFAGILDNRYQGTFVGHLGDVLNQQCSALGMTNWKSQYTWIAGGHFMQGLRDLLYASGTRCWVELTAGSSWLEYGALDVYVRFLSAGMPPPREHAWYIVNYSGMPDSRFCPPPEDWYQFTDWRNVGQREGCDEWYIPHASSLSRLWASWCSGRMSSQFCLGISVAWSFSPLLW